MAEQITREQVTKHVAQRVREARAGSGLLQGELALRCGWSQVAQCLYESGKRRVGIYELCRMADALERPLAFFLDDLPAEGAQDA